MFDECHALLYVLDFTLEVNKLLQKKGEAVEFVLMEFSLHHDEECAQPADVTYCRNKIKTDLTYVRQGMINIIVVDPEEPFFMGINDEDDPFIRGQTELYQDFKAGAHGARVVWASPRFTDSTSPLRTPTQVLSSVLPPSTSLLCISTVHRRAPTTTPFQVRRKTTAHAAGQRAPPLPPSSHMLQPRSVRRRQ